MTTLASVAREVEDLTGFDVPYGLRLVNDDPPGPLYALLQWGNGPEEYIGLVLVPNGDLQQSQFWRLRVPRGAFQNCTNDQLVGAGIYATRGVQLKETPLPRIMRKAVRAKRLYPRFEAVVA